MRRLAAYNAAGLLSSVTDEVGSVTTYLRPNGYDVEEVRSPLHTSKVPHRTTQTQYQPCGTLETITDENDGVTAYSYDAFCRLERVDEPSGAYVRYEYGVDANTKRTYRTEYRTPAKGDVEIWSRDDFDGFGRVLKSSAIAASGKTSVAEYGYQRHEAVAQSVTRFRGDAPLWTFTWHDALGRPTRKQHADGATVLWNYGLREVVKTDERGNQSRDRFDAHGAVVETSTLVDGVWRGIFHQYDRLGRIEKTTDDDGNTWSYEHDSLGRLFARSDPNLGSWSFEHDDAGRVETQVDAKQQTTTFTYDALGRIETKTNSDGKTSWFYDEVRAGAYNKGRLTRVVDAHGHQEVDYGVSGHPQRVARRVDGVDYETTYRRDAAGRLLGITFPDGDEVGTSDSPITYNEAGEVRSIPKVVVVFTYDAAGRVTMRIDDNYTVVRNDYSESRGWLEETVAWRGTGTLYEYDYGYYSNGALHTVDGPRDESWTFNYDARNQLTFARGPNFEGTYEYTATGNLKRNPEMGPEEYVYPKPGAARPYAVTQAGGSSYTYDANGNMLSGRGRTLVWNSDNMPIAINGDTYVYDGLGERLKKTESGRTTIYLGSDIEIAVGAAGSSDVMTKRIRVGNEVVAARVGQETQWMHTDVLGSIRAVDRGGELEFEQAFSPYGRTLSGSPESVGLGFTGAPTDSTGLIYLRARYYDPYLGRFISPDTIVPRGDALGFNSYAYGYNGPTLYIDPTGHFPWGALVRTMVGAGKLGLGIAMCVGTVGGGCGPGIILITLGLDDLSSGLPSLVTGNRTPSVFEAGFTSVCRAAGAGDNSGACGAGMNMALHTLGSAYAGGLAVGAGGGGGAAGAGAAEGAGIGEFLGVFVTAAEGATTGQVASGLASIVGTAAAGAVDAKMKGNAAANGGGRQFNVSKSESPVWKSLQPGKNGYRTSGSGRNQRHYKWDHTHNDIEVFDRNGRHLGSMNPTTGEMYKGPVAGRTM